MIEVFVAGFYRGVSALGWIAAVGIGVAALLGLGCGIGLMLEDRNDGREE